MSFLQQLEEIKSDLDQYYKLNFKTDLEDYNYNKSLKNRLKKLIINVSDDSKIKKKVLLVLAQNTGCSEDHEIAEEIINHLFDNNFIDEIHLNYYYDNVSTNRWY